MKDHTIDGDETIAGGVNSLLANRYLIVRQLGQGGMGSVWLVEDTQLDNKPFAVKMLPSILVSNKRAYRQLKDEAIVAMRLTHPNIVQIRAFEENNGNPFLVMDYIDGQTLDDYLAEHTGTTGVPSAAGGISEADVLRILRPVAAALDYAHGKGVVHRDVKPGNVMIATDGTPYILDFGIAREIQETMTRVTGKLSSGTLLYMSPEQLMGAQPKPAQDVYSFAAMVYECLKGEPPFARGQIEYQIMNAPPEPLNLPTGGSSVRGSSTLAASVMDGLAKKPEDRPATCAAVLRGSGAPAASVGAASPSLQQPGGARLSRPSPGGSRSRATVIAITILLAAFLAIVGGASWVFDKLISCRPAGKPDTSNDSSGDTITSPTSGGEAPASQHPRTAEDRLQAGESALQREDYAQALEFFSSVITEKSLPDPLRAKAYVGRGTVELTQRNVDFARLSFLHAQRLDLKNKMSWYYLGLIYRDFYRFYEAAEEHFRMFVRLSKPDDPRVKKVNYEIVPELRRTLAGIAAARPGASTSKPNQAASLIQEAQALEDKKQLMAATEKYAAAFAADPQSYAAALGYARLVRRTDKTKEGVRKAILAYRAAIDQKPAVQEPYLEVARLARENQLWVQAVEIMNRAVAHAPQNKEALDQLIGALIKAGNEKLANAWGEYRKELRTFEGTNGSTKGINRSPIKRPPLQGGGGPLPKEHPETYVVQQGDTIMGIAQRFYGSSSKWRDIRQANMAILPMDGRVSVGQRLRLPDLQGEKDHVMSTNLPICRPNMIVNKTLEGFRYSATNQVEEIEARRCVSLVAAAIRYEWNKESFKWRSGLRPIQVNLQLGAGGVVRGYAIQSRSGDPDVDRTALNALQRLHAKGRIDGLSTAFIERYPEMSIVMEPTEP